MSFLASFRCWWRLLGCGESLFSRFLALCTGVHCESVLIFTLRDISGFVLPSFTTIRAGVWTFVIWVAVMGMGVPFFLSVLVWVFVCLFIFMLPF